VLPDRTPVNGIVGYPNALPFRKLQSRRLKGNPNNAQLKQYSIELKAEVEDIWRLKGVKDKFSELEENMEVMAKSKGLICVIYALRIQSLLVTCLSASILYLFYINDLIGYHNEIQKFNCLLPEFYHYDVREKSNGNHLIRYKL